MCKGDRSSRGERAGKFNYREEDLENIYIFSFILICIYFLIVATSKSLYSMNILKIIFWTCAQQ